MGEARIANRRRAGGGDADARLRGGRCAGQTKSVVRSTAGLAAVVVRTRRRLVGAMARGETGRPIADEAGCRFRRGRGPPQPPRQQHRHVARWNAAGLHLGHPHEIVHPPTGSTESHRASGNAGSKLAVLFPRRALGRFSAGGKLNKISVEGGAVVPLGEVRLAGASWAEDGSIVMGDAMGKGLLQLPAAGGAPTIVAPQGNGEGPRCPATSAGSQSDPVCAARDRRRGQAPSKC